MGRPPEARFPSLQFELGDAEVTKADLQSVISKVGVFGDDNRAGIERTLHRISVMRNRAGDPVGLTCRVGRAVFGAVQLVEDLVRSGESILFLGRPGVGKTTLLREVARFMAEDLDKRVVVVDTSNEIAGDGDVPHPAIGRARRMQVPQTALQHRVMIEAVENHTPEVIIIDEMSTELEALAARTIAERGVQLVATAHGNTLDNLIANPSLADLTGGTQTVTLGDLEARRRGTQKTVLERKHEPTFDIIVEIRERNHVALHRSAGTVVDLMLRGYPPEREVRWLDPAGVVHTQMEMPEVTSTDSRPPAFDVREIRRPHSDTTRPSPRVAVGALPAPSAPEQTPAPVEAPAKIHPFGVARVTLQEAIADLRARAVIADSAQNADLFVTTKSHYNRRPTEIREAERNGIPVYVLRRGTTEQITEFLRRFGPSRNSGRGHQAAGLGRNGGSEDPDSGPARDRAGRQDAEVKDAISEAEQAVQRVLNGERKVTLAPQSSFIRRMQHDLAAQYQLGSASIGGEPARRVVIRRRR